MKFTILDLDLEKCQKFAEDSVGTNASKYAYRGQGNILKVKTDITVGKLGEIAAYNFLSPKYPNLSGPDFQIYQKKDKSWSPDLLDPVANIKVGVKSQDIKSSNAYGMSWVFQYNFGKNFDCDKEVFGEEKEPNHLICFVSVNLPKKEGEIKGLVQVPWLHENQMFKPMKKANLVGNKVAVYMEDLEKHENIWQF